MRINTAGQPSVQDKENVYDFTPIIVSTPSASTIDNGPPSSPYEMDNISQKSIQCTTTNVILTVHGVDGPVFTQTLLPVI